jgi:translation initiation factor IF-2
MSEKKEENLIIRPPVVTVLGHIDHGKSSLLCAIKDFKITERESGGITQHIGAYEIEHQNKKITFIDTPGHEAFSAMRSRGAKVADIVILVIAAEEGVKPQTKEVIERVKEYSIPVIVAINKIDKPTADPAKVKLELARNDLLLESEGGKIPSIDISAKTGEGIKDLLDLITLIAEMEELKADLSASPEGVIIESYLDSKRGPTTTLLLKNGVLKIGDIVGTSSTCGKIKILENFQGDPIKRVTPSMPAIALGFNEIPKVGEKFKTFSNMEKATESKNEKEEENGQLNKDGNKKYLNIVLRADVTGSLEVLEQVLNNLPQERGELRIIKKGIGEITENDIRMAESADAIILGFKVKTNSQMTKMGESRNVKIKTFDVIYNLIEEIEKIMEKKFKPEKELKETGRIKVVEIFRTEKKRQIVGGKVIKGNVLQGARIEILSQDEEKIGSGRIVTLQKEQKRVDKAGKGDECGILFEGGTKIEEGNILSVQVYE